MTEETASAPYQLPPMIVDDAGIRHIDLANLHQWILDARAMLVDSEPEGPNVDNFDVVGDDDDNPADIKKINKALHQLADRLAGFDCTFHDLFDCR